MTTKNQEIQQLLAAEKRAADTVAEARKRKARRLKQAKDEALKEIEAYKVQRQSQYEKLETQLLGSKSTAEDVIQEKTLKTIEGMQQAFNKNRESVLKDVLELFSQIKLGTHENLNNQ